MSAGPAVLFDCTTCGRQCASTRTLEEDLREQDTFSAWGTYTAQGPTGPGKCGICWTAERTLERYLLIGGQKARAFVEKALAETPAILRPR